MTRKASFPPIVDARTRVLLLGSLPGEASLKAERYYAHPQNQFWKLVGGAIGVDLHAMDYNARLAALRAAHVGVWDVVADAVRAGSLDGAIKDHRGNDLTGLIDRLPALRAIGFNGGTAARIGRKLLAGATHPPLIDLPSSSPAFTKPLSEKQHAWSAVSFWLGAAKI
ncbi:DNA-deoxyinosine glycosylase [Sphingomonas montanisoli]|uniref:DNA-deoxyinosine glycosylase n=1 Tax=Sphingomonas montanisoli TaxID=2606412 RepID=A0A5D9C8K9_9SPHN|nr:DNA-deoxyinosine glycosylase [Sphingomonas montanisoli]TZG27703.1 DNA-deoxyinosine glycosylase [Sphingomonas montanisoli]